MNEETKTNRQISYFTMVFKQIGERPFVNEKFVFDTKNYQKDSYFLHKMAEFAVFSAEMLQEVEQAEQFFRESVRKDPKDYIGLGNYAIFLHYYKRDIKKAIHFYEKCHRESSGDLFFTYNYVLALLFCDKDYQTIDKLTKKLLFSDSLRLVYWNLYAIVLFKKKREFEKAERILKFLINKEAKDPRWFLAYAELKILLGNYEEAANMLNHALTLDTIEELQLEMWFIAYAFLKEKRETAQENIEDLLSKGYRAYMVGMQEYIKLAIENEHDSPEVLISLYKQIVDTKSENTLNENSDLMT